MLIRNIVEAVVKTVNRRPPQGRSGGLGLATSSGGMSSGGSLTYLRAYGSVGWLFRAVSRISEATASVNWRYQRYKPDGTLEDVPDMHGTRALRLQDRVMGVIGKQEGPNRGPLQLWNKPNPFYTRQEFVETFQQHFELVGEAWWLLLRDSRNQITELWPLRPDRMTPIPHPTEYLTGYVYRVGNERIPLDLDDVIFLRNPNPIDPYRGMGVVQAILADLDSEKYSAQWNRNFFLNSAEPGGIIEVDKSLSDAEFEKSVLRWRQQHQGVARAHRVAIIEHGKWVDRQYSMRDMQFDRLRRANRDIILGSLGFPLHMLGISEDVNRANAEAAELMFTRWLIKPNLVRIAQALNERLLPLLGVEDCVFVFDDPVPANRELNLEIADRGYAGGYVTQNEARDFVGLGAVEGGEEFAPPKPAAPPFGLAQAVGIGKRVPLLLQTADAESSPGDEVVEAWFNRLQREVRAIIVALREQIPNPSASAAKTSQLTYDWDWWARYGEEVIAELLNLSIGGLVAEGLLETQAHRLATEYAKARAADLLRIDGDLSLVTYTRQRVADIVSAGIAEGQSIDGMARTLRADFGFSRERAGMIARTETAEAWGSASIMAGKAQGRDEKRQVSQGDAGVCSICEPNEAAGWIRIDDRFPSGHLHTPCHPLCRCSITTRTRELHEEEAGKGRRTETRCPDCDKLLGWDVVAGHFRCPRCKAEIKVGEV